MTPVEAAILAYGLAALLVWRETRRCPERFLENRCARRRGHRGPCWIKEGSHR